MQAIEVLAKAKEALAKYTLCEACLGRLFGMLGYGLTNKERGAAIKTLLIMEAYDAVSGDYDQKLIARLASSGFEPAKAALSKLSFGEVEEERCYICEGLLKSIEKLAQLCLKAGEEYEYDTFQVGCSLPKEVIKREEELWLKLGLDRSESLKNELTREIGKVIQSCTGKEYSPSKPDLVFIIDVGKRSVSVYANPIYIYGRYRKLVRGLPQSPWPYPPDERVAYRTSIEELISEPLIKLAKAEGAKLHAAGREDLDVRTLGSGRPFIVELKNPRIRRIDLKLAEKLINDNCRGLVEVEALRYVDGSLVPKLKAFAEIAKKKYVAKVKLSQAVTEQDVRRLEEELSGAVIRQRTPLRVLSRRADKVRRKVVYEVKGRLLKPTLLLLEITCQGGLYVKELIHGDQGRTKPNVSEILGVDAEVEELDVVWIEEPAIVEHSIS